MSVADQKLSSDPLVNEIVVVAPHLSVVGATLIKFFEQSLLKAYLPTPDDVPTIGWGLTRYPENSDWFRWAGRKVRMGDEITQEEADRLFLGEVRNRAAAVHHLLEGTPTSQPQLDALISFAYNVGVDGLAGSTLLQRHLQGRTDAAHAQFSLWIYQGRKRLNGLIKRRALEGALYMTPEGRDPPWLIRKQKPGRPPQLGVKEPRL